MTHSTGLAPFDHQPRTRLILGAGTLSRLGELAREVGGSRVLLVTDKGIVNAGHVALAQQSLAAAGVKVSVYDRVRENPGTQDVNDCVAVAQHGAVDLIVGLGGGSSMDTAKGCNFLLTNGGRMQDYWGVNKASQPMLPFIAIPTTAGTGSECQSAALIVDEVTHQKMACLDAKCAARIAILDPTLTVSQPSRVTTCTGIDAVAHAVETAVTTKRNAISEMYSREAFRLCIGALPAVLLNPNDLSARGQMLLGAALAGCAIENSMLGAAHSAANPLTAHLGIVHGQAVGLMLPHIVRFNGTEASALAGYAELARFAGLSENGESAERAWKTLIARLESLLELTELRKSLAEFGMKREQIPALAEEAARQWTANFNPRTISTADFERMYVAADQPL